MTVAWFHIRITSQISAIIQISQSTSGNAVTIQAWSVIQSTFFKYTIYHQLDGLNSTYFKTDFFGKLGIWNKMTMSDFAIRIGCHNTHTLSGINSQTR